MHPPSLPVVCKRAPKPGRARAFSAVLSGYALAVLVFALAFACVALSGHLLDAAPPVSLFLCAVIFVAWFAGLGPALLTCALSVLAFGYFYLWPLDSLTLASRDLPRIVLFGIASLFIAAVSAAQRRTSASLRSARDQLQDAVAGLEAANAELMRENAERRAAEAALRRSEAYLDHAQQLSRTGSFGRNIATGDIVWSKEVYRILGIDPSVRPNLDLVMRHVPPEEWEFVRKELGRPVAGACSLDVEHRWLMPDGSVKQLHIRARRVRYASGQGEQEEMVGALMDVTEARQAQEALAEAQALLAHANRVATLGALAASIAHEVNQPLAAIVANGDANLRWLEREVPPLDTVREGLERMIADAERASSVVNRVRALARKDPSEHRLVDLNAVINDVVKLVAREIASQAVSLRLELAPDLPAVRGDRVQLQQLIINLVINGIQAMTGMKHDPEKARPGLDPGCAAVFGKDHAQEEPGLASRPRRLTIRSERDEAGGVRLLVEDSGHGIDPANANRLFDAFYTTKSGGMGLGLSICRSIVEAHGGRIWAANHGGGGAVFAFTLPDPARRAGAGAAHAVPMEI